MTTNSDAATLSTFEGLVRRRHSCRAFRPNAIPREVVERMLGVAQCAASDCNAQPWRLLVVEGRALDRLRHAMYERAASGAAPVYDIAPIAKYTGIYLERRRECGWALYGAVGVQKGDRAASHQQALENYRFFGAPHLALVLTDASLGARALLDCGGYIATFMLTAEALGVASVPQAAIAYRADIIREQLGLPADSHVVCGISFGWPDKTHPANSYRTTRASVADVVEYRSE